MTNVIRICPGCSKVQRWCDDPMCGNEPGDILPQGHWTHLDVAATEACYAVNGLEFIGTVS